MVFKVVGVSGGLRSGGAVVNPRLASRLKLVARDLVVYGTMIRSQFRRDLIDREPHAFASRYGR